MKIFFTVCANFTTIPTASLGSDVGGVVVKGVEDDFVDVVEKVVSSITGDALLELLNGEFVPGVVGGKNLGVVCHLIPE